MTPFTSHPPSAPLIHTISLSTSLSLRRCERVKRVIFPVSAPRRLCECLTASAAAVSRMINESHLSGGLREHWWATPANHTDPCVPSSEGQCVGGTRRWRRSCTAPANSCGLMSENVNICQHGKCGDASVAPENVHWNKRQGIHCLMMSQR